MWVLMPTSYLLTEKNIQKFSLKYGLRFSNFTRLGQDELNVYANDEAVIYNSEFKKYESAEAIGVNTFKKSDVISTFNNFEPRASISYLLDDNTSLKASYNGSEPGVAEENIQARARGSIIMALSNKFNWLVLSTGNKTELAMGYCTLYGDMNGGLAVISDLSKTDVYALSKWVNKNAGFERIPLSSIEKPPSAELRPEQVDPFDYDVVSPLVSSLIDDEKSPSELIKEGADPELVKDISSRIRINEYKRRQAAPGLKVTSKAFGMGRRVPIINQYDELKHD